MHVMLIYSCKMRFFSSTSYSFDMESTDVSSKSDTVRKSATFPRFSRLGSLSNSLAGNFCSRVFLLFQACFGFMHSLTAIECGIFAVRGFLSKRTIFAIGK